MRESSKGWGSWWRAVNVVMIGGAVNMEMERIKEGDDFIVVHVAGNVGNVVI